MVPAGEERAPRAASQPRSSSVPPKCDAPAAALELGFAPEEMRTSRPRATAPVEEVEERAPAPAGEVAFDEREVAHTLARAAATARDPAERRHAVDQRANGIPVPQRVGKPRRAGAIASVMRAEYAIPRGEEAYCRSRGPALGPQSRLLDQGGPMPRVRTRTVIGAAAVAAAQHCRSRTHAQRTLPRGVSQVLYELASRRGPRPTPRRWRSARSSSTTSASR